MYLKYVTAHNHPLANKLGRIKESRFVLFKKINGVAGVCNWCKIKLTWKTLCADHLDGNNKNNLPENIVGSCRGCNANREDGTNHGRQKPKLCKCGKLFIGGSHHKHQIYCSRECVCKNRPKLGTNAKHGTRSRYMYGCRCQYCISCNSSYWTKWKKGLAGLN